MGGYADVELNDMWRFSLETGEWTEIEMKGSIPKLYFHSAITWNKSILIFGGWTTAEKNSNEVFCFDIGTI